MNIIDLLIGRKLGGAGGSGDGSGGVVLPILTNPAQAAHILAPKDAIDSSGKRMVGTMPDNGAVSKTLTRTTPEYTIPAGRHDGTGKVLVLLEEKTVTPGTEAQEITPSTGKLLSKVIVEAAESDPGGGEAGDFVITDASYLFYNGARLTDKDLFLAALKTPTKMESMFQNCSSLKDVDLSSVDMSQVTSIKNLFSGCSGLTQIDLNSLSTDKVTDMFGLFDRCTGLTSLDLSNFYTGNVTTMEGMFNGCSNLESLDLRSFDTSKVTSFTNFFYGCTKLKTVDLSSFDTQKVASMAQMFASCSQLTSVDLSNFDTSLVAGWSQVFHRCSSLQEIIGFSAMKSAGMAIAFPTSTSSSSKYALRRLTFRTDLPEGQYAIRSYVNVRNCDFDNTGVQEMLDTITDVSNLGISSSQTQVCLTGNPCVTGTRKDGTACDLLTDDIRNGFLAKGWTLVE